jgi:hypothetical protein
MNCCQATNPILFGIENTTNIYEDRLGTAGGSSDSSKLKTRLGAGLGVGLGVPLLFSIALLYLEHRKRVMTERQLTGLQNGATKMGISYAAKSLVEGPPVELRAWHEAQELPTQQH